MGSALKYLWRAGKKDGESAEKDRAKAKHFMLFEAKKTGACYEYMDGYISHLLKLAEMDYVGILYFTNSQIMNIGKHYNHAVDKHPYFADRLLAPELDKRWFTGLLNQSRKNLSDAIQRGDLTIHHVLDCKIAEMNDALAKGETDSAIEEAYDCIAVLLRVIDVLEKRQPLGNPEKKETPNEK